MAADDGAAFADDGADGGGVAGDFVGELEEVLEFGFDGGAGGWGGGGGEVVPCVAGAGAEAVAAEWEEPDAAVEDPVGGEAGDV